jgi:hypothetical protein
MNESRRLKLSGVRLKEDATLGLAGEPVNNSKLIGDRG